MRPSLRHFLAQLDRERLAQERSLTRLTRDEVEAMLRAIFTLPLVEESAEQFAFRHALTQQAVYADLLVRERKALHRSIADTMERLYVPSLDAHLADLAYHFYESGTWEKALVYGQRAGEQAYRLYAPHGAIEQVTRALDAAQRGSIPSPATLYSPAWTGVRNPGEL